MKVIIDGDSLVYTIGFASQKNIWQVFDVDQPELILYENELKSLCLNFIEDQEGTIGTLDVCKRIEVSPVEHAYHSLKIIIQKIAARAKANSYKIYLTGGGAGNFRHQVATIQGYKHNRLNAEKPMLYQEIRDYLVTYHKATIVEGMEADDALSIVHARSVSGDPVNVSNDPAHPVFRHPDECIIGAIDKDLRNIPGKHINFDKRVAENDEYKFIVVTEEEGRRSFWKQVLTGDSADNILGIPGMGPKKADVILDSLITKSEEEYFWAVYAAYKKHYGNKPFEYYRFDAYEDTTATFRKRVLKDDADIQPDQRLVGTALTFLLENARLLWMLRVQPNPEGTHWWMPPLSFEAIAIEDEAIAWAEDGMKEEKAKQDAQGYASADISQKFADYEDKGMDKPWTEGRGKWFVVTGDNVPVLIGPVGSKKKVQDALKDYKSVTNKVGDTTNNLGSDNPDDIPDDQQIAEDTQTGDEDTQIEEPTHILTEVGLLPADHPDVQGVTDTPVTEQLPDCVYYNIDRDGKWGYFSKELDQHGPYDSEDEARKAWGESLLVEVDESSVVTPEPDTNIDNVTVRDSVTIEEASGEIWDSSFS